MQCCPLLDIKLNKVASKEALHISERVKFNDSITYMQYHRHQPYGNNFGQSSEIRIAIQQQDIYTLPYESFLLVQGKLLKTDGTVGSTSKIASNGILFLFDRISYELNGTELDNSKEPGITSSLKTYISATTNHSACLENSGWNHKTSNAVKVNQQGQFEVLIPLNLIFGFAEDYKKILVNAKQELVLVRSNSDANALFSDANEETPSKIELTNIEWIMPHLKVSDKERLSLFNTIKKEKNVDIAFRSWDLYVYPTIPKVSKHTWQIKTSSQLEKPRYVVLAFQTDREKNTKKDRSIFDHCKLKNAKLYLNSECFPYAEMNIDFSGNIVSTLYNMYAQFQKSYYRKDDASPLLGPVEFTNICPSVVFDVSNQTESVKSGTVDARLEFEFAENCADKTNAYCLVIHDKIVTYNTFSGEVKKIL